MRQMVTLWERAASLEPNGLSHSDLAFPLDDYIPAITVVPPVTRCSIIRSDVKQSIGDEVTSRGLSSQ